MRSRRLAGESARAGFQAVSPGYFATLRIPLVRGRLLAAEDRAGAPAAAVVSETFARRFFAGRDPIGQRFRGFQRAPDSPELTIVGVVRDARRDGPHTDLTPLVYLAAAQPDTYAEQTHLWEVAVRAAAGDPRRLLPAIQRAVWSIDPFAADHERADARRGHRGIDGGAPVQHDAAERGGDPGRRARDRGRVRRGRACRRPAHARDRHPHRPRRRPPPRPLARGRERPAVGARRRRLRTRRRLRRHALPGHVAVRCHADRPRDVRWSRGVHAGRRGARQLCSRRAAPRRGIRCRRCGETDAGCYCLDATTGARRSRSCEDRKEQIRLVFAIIVVFFLLRDDAVAPRHLWDRFCVLASSPRPRPRSSRT